MAAAALETAREFDIAATVARTERSCFAEPRRQKSSCSHRRPSVRWNVHDADSSRVAVSHILFLAGGHGRNPISGAEHHVLTLVRELAGAGVDTELIVLLWTPDAASMPRWRAYTRPACSVRHRAPPRRSQPPLPSRARSRLLVAAVASACAVAENASCTCTWSC